jgi:O-antigen/teichoic acid export membrane protein
VIASFLTGFFLSPYIIRKLGEQRYGIWALAFAFIDYFTFFDFGFKSAIVNFVSRFRGQNDREAINEVVNTALFYFVGIATVLLTATWLISGQLHRFFKISPVYQAEFAVLVRIIGVGWSAAIALNVFVAGLEAFQRFKAQNHISVLSLILRSGASAVLLFFGYGLTAMGVAVMFSQFVSYGLTFLSFRRAFPALRISPSLVRRSMWKQLAKYGIHSFVAQLGGMLQNQGPPVLIGHYRTEAFVGYYALPNRLLQYMVELVTRIASVTTPNTAELLAQGKRDRIARLGVYLNRYCFALFVPLSLFLLIYGKALIQLWVGPAFSMHAAPLLPAFVLMTSFGVAGQFNSVGILFGMAKHDTFAKAMVAEAVTTLTGMALVLPRFGILGAAWVACGVAIANRGLVTPYLLCRNLELSLPRYLRSIYLVPVLLALPSAALAYWMRNSWLPGKNWVELLTALAFLSAQYYAIFFFTGFDKEHRWMLQEWVTRRLQIRRARA